MVCQRQCLFARWALNLAVLLEAAFGAAHARSGFGAYPLSLPAKAGAAVVRLNWRSELLPAVKAIAEVFWANDKLDINYDDYASLKPFSRLVECLADSREREQLDRIRLIDHEDDPKLPDHKRFRLWNPGGKSPLPTPLLMWRQADLIEDDVVWIVVVAESAEGCIIVVADVQLFFSPKRVSNGFHRREERRPPIHAHDGSARPGGHRKRDSPKAGARLRNSKPRHESQAQRQTT